MALLLVRRRACSRGSVVGAGARGGTDRRGAGRTPAWARRGPSSSRAWCCCSSSRRRRPSAWPTISRAPPWCGSRCRAARALLLGARMLRLAPVSSWWSWAWRAAGVAVPVHRGGVGGRPPRRARGSRALVSCWPCTRPCRRARGAARLVAGQGAAGGRRDAAKDRVVSVWGGAGRALASSGLSGSRSRRRPASSKRPGSRSAPR